ncbi:MAG TPA: PepSY-associated TM helix domain-containing protein [Bacteroidales bacterium]|nr:PepSY-associated TM helix domain-containing protein [Bacteroidales bacterium]HSA42295.1 PepSY-associated TM helix domain-containing protein [Bacteroidales bacterium]
MSRAGKKKWFKKWHKWPALILSVFILLFSLSGIVLNHRSFFSGADVSRRLIPETYRYKNWNLAAVRGGLSWKPDSLLVYGNIGIWLIDSNLTKFKDFNQGFPEGIDKRKISSLAKTADGGLYAGTLFGLYRYVPEAGSWQEVSLPVDEKRVVKVLFSGGTLWVMTRSYLMRSVGAGLPRFEMVHIGAPPGDDGRVSLFRTLWVIHSGEIYGMAGRLLVDFIGFVFIFLTLTGLVYFVTPYTVKNLSAKLKSRWKRFNRWSLRWHNITGSWLILLLILTAATGIFLRPPLLIAIGDSRIGKIPFSVLANPNPWQDKLRDLVYDDSSRHFMLATSEGIFRIDPEFRGSPEYFSFQPPVSVMGINVFEPLDEGSWLIGSFSGLYRWNPQTRILRDHVNGAVVDAAALSGSPFGGLAVAGYLQTPSGTEVVFDYGKGAMFRNTKGGISSEFPSMPSEIIEKSPMSLWNLALEFHTCRIYGVWIGDFYILLIPLFGLGILFILVTGFFSWYYGRKKKRAAAAMTVRKQASIYAEAEVTH